MFLSHTKIQRNIELNRRPQKWLLCFSGESKWINHHAHNKLLPLFTPLSLALSLSFSVSIPNPYISILFISVLISLSLSFILFFSPLSLHLCLLLSRLFLSIAPLFSTHPTPRHPAPHPSLSDIQGCEQSAVSARMVIVLCCIVGNNWVTTLTISRVIKRWLPLEYSLLFVVFW